MTYSHGDLWAALYDIAGEKPTVTDIAPEIIAKLIEIGAVERKATGLPVLTDYGYKCYEILESGNDVYVPELDDLQAAK